MWLVPVKGIRTSLMIRLMFDVWRESLVGDHPSSFSFSVT